MVTYPYHAVFSVTHTCPLSCVHCSANAGKAVAGELTTDQAFDVISQLRDAGVFDLSFSGGEPLARADIWKLLEHAKQKGFIVGVGSSGVMFNDRNVKRLHQLGVDRAQISIDGTSETHDRIRGMKGLYKRAMAAVDMCVREGLITNICFTPNAMNVDEFETVVATAVEHGVSTINVSQYVPVGRGTCNIDIPPQDQHDLFIRWKNLKDHYSGRVSFKSHLVRRALVDEEARNMAGFEGCQAGKAMSAIDPYGNVYPCVMLPVAIGNMTEKPFKEVWSSSPLIKAFQEREVSGYCRGCEHVGKCGGCRAVAYAYTGDSLASDPSCWLYDHESHACCQ